MEGTLFEFSVLLLFASGAATWVIVVVVSLATAAFVDSVVTTPFDYTTCSWVGSALVGTFSFTSVAVAA